MIALVTIQSDTHMTTVLVGQVASDAHAKRERHQGRMDRLVTHALSESAPHLKEALILLAVPLLCVVSDLAHRNITYITIKPAADVHLREMLSRSSFSDFP